MSESQSRYSIVERLTQTKLGILESKNQLDLDIKRLENDISVDETRLTQWVLDVQEDVKRQTREQERKIEEKKTSLKTSKQYRDEKIKMFDDKLVEINKALVAIQDISKSSSEEANAGVKN